MKLKFNYNKKTDKTIISIFKNSVIVDILEMDSNISKYTQNRIKEELLRKYIGGAK